jgi:hypothetical protein
MAKGLIRTGVSWPALAVLCVAAALSATSVHLAWATVFSPIPAGVARKPAPALDFAAFQAAETPAFEVDALLARPVFSPTRSAQRAAPPPEPVDVVAEEPPPAPPQVQPPSYIVGGIVITPTARRTLLRTQPREPGRWVGQGEMTAEGWTVSSVEREAVLLDRDGSSFTLLLQGRSRGE